VGQLKALVDELLEVSRITTGRIRLHCENVDVRGVVDRAVESARPLIDRRRHQLTMSLPPEPVWLHADSTRLEQLVVNLLTNAAKYTDEEGRISLALEREGEEAVLRVRDMGVGIAPDLLPRIFDLFTQAERSLDRSQGGLGVGLTVVQKLVEMHRGRVGVHSALGQGSEFVVRLPVIQPSDPPIPCGCWWSMTTWTRPTAPPCCCGFPDTRSAWRIPGRPHWKSPVNTGRTSC
jgi:signal transduction histidine kinase